MDEHYASIKVTAEGRMFGVMTDHLIRLGSLLWPLTATSWIMVVNTMMQSDILISAHRQIDFEPN